MPIDMKTVRFDFKDNNHENIFASVVFEMPKEIVDNALSVLSEKGCEAFIAALPCNIVGNLNWENMYAFHTPHDIHQIMTKEEFVSKNFIKI